MLIRIHEKKTYMCFQTGEVALHKKTSKYFSNISVNETNAPEHGPFDP